MPARGAPPPVRRREPIVEIVEANPRLDEVEPPAGFDAWADWIDYAIETSANAYFSKNPTDERTSKKRQFKRNKKACVASDIMLYLQPYIETDQEKVVEDTVGLRWRTLLGDRYNKAAAEAAKKGLPTAPPPNNPSSGPSAPSTPSSLPPGPSPAKRPARPSANTPPRADELNFETIKMWNPATMEGIMIDLYDDGFVDSGGYITPHAFDMLHNRATNDPVLGMHGSTDFALMAYDDAGVNIKITNLKWLFRIFNSAQDDPLGIRVNITGYVPAPTRLSTGRSRPPSSPPRRSPPHQSSSPESQKSREAKRARRDGSEGADNKKPDDRESAANKKPDDRESPATKKPDNPPEPPSSPKRSGADPPGQPPARTVIDLTKLGSDRSDDDSDTDKGDKGDQSGGPPPLPDDPPDDDDDSDPALVTSALSNDARTVIDPDFLQRCCDLLQDSGWDFATWDPNARQVILPGLRQTEQGSVMNYQVYAALYILHNHYKWARESKRLSEDGARGPLATIMGLEPGLGKTLVTLVMWLLRIHVAKALKDFKRRKGSGEVDDPLPPTGFRCDCGPNSLARQLWTRNGITLAIVPLSLLRPWKSEFDRWIDLEELARSAGLTAAMFIGHHTTKSEDTFDLADYKPASLTLQNWADANGTDIAGVEKLILLQSPDLKHPKHPQVSMDVRGLFILSTPMSVHRYVLSKMGTIMQPAISKRPIPCQHSPEERNKPRHASTHLLESRELRCEGSLPIAEIFLDEAHDPQQILAIKQFGSHCRDQVIYSEFFPAITPMTGTPRPNSPFALVPYLLWLNEKRWDESETLQWFNDEDVDLANEAFRLVGLLADPSVRLTLKHFRKFNVRFPPGTTTVLKKGLADNAVRKVWLKYGKPLATELWNHFCFELQGEDEYKGKPFISLLGLEHTDVFIPASPAMEAYFATAKSEWAKQVARTKQAGSGAGEYRKEASKLQQLSRYNTIVGNIPALHKILNGNMHEAMAEHIHRNNMFESPQKSPYWAAATDIYNSSAKVKFCADFYRKMPPIEPDPTLLIGPEGQERQLEEGPQRDQLVIMVWEPVLALALLCALRKALPDINVEAIYRNKGTGASLAARTRILERFQKLPILDKGTNQQAPPEETRPYDRPIHILVVCSKVGGTGLTLTRACNMIRFDVDTDVARLTQVPKRIHRVTQKRPCMCTQLCLTSAAFPREHNALSTVKSKRTAVDLTTPGSVFSGGDEPAADPPPAEALDTNMADAGQGETRDTLMADDDQGEIQ